MYGGYDSFRGYQQDAILSVLKGEDVFFLANTGLGKSVCYQLPAIMSEGTAIIISPLLALMADQIEGLKDKGINARTLNSTTGIKELRTIRKELTDKSLKLLYVAPETLLKESTLILLEETATMSFIACDESHMCSQVGHDFRKHYSQLGELKSIYPNIPIIALTATATPATVKDILKILAIPNATVYNHSLDRPNIRYYVHHKIDVGAQVLKIVKSYPTDTVGIVYCMAREKTELIAKYLKANGVNADYFHAKRTIKEKRQVLKDFLNGKIKVLVGSSAIGMGLDKSDIRFVINADLSLSLEEFVQAAGRNGRDGKESDSHLLYSSRDITTAKFLIRSSTKNLKRLSNNYQKLDDMVDYCTSGVCRRNYLLNYFNEESKVCNNCDICLGITEY